MSSTRLAAVAASVVITGLLASALPCQDCVYVPDDKPEAGGNNLIPFGHKSPSNSLWSNQKYQTLILSSVLGKKSGSISEIAFAPSADGYRQFATIRIRMAQRPIAKLSSTFASNLGTQSILVLDSRDYVWRSHKDSWNRIGLQQSFPYVPQGGNLVVDIEVTGAGMPDATAPHPGYRSVVSIPRLYAVGWDSSPPPDGDGPSGYGVRMELCFDLADASPFGLGCEGSNGKVPFHDYEGVPHLDETVTLQLTDGPATAPTILVLGLSSGEPYPIDLTPAGAPGCRLYESPDLIFVVVTDGSGTTQMPLPIPNSNAILGLRLYTQYILFDEDGNKLGWIASNFVRVLIGS